MSHPPHLSPTQNSAFIPFCAYKTDLAISENELSLSEMAFPICSSFLPTILDGQLCYRLTLNKTSAQGRKNELMLLLDYNEDLSISAPTKGSTEFSEKTLNFDEDSERSQFELAKIHINTLSPHIGFGGGTYTMTVVKKMSAKSDFLKMPLNERECSIETLEECKTRKLLEECNCVPWEVPGYEVGS